MLVPATRQRDVCRMLFCVAVVSESNNVLL